MNVPNLITLSRLAVTIVCFVCVGFARTAAGGSDPAMMWWAFGLFIFAAVTDFVDGYLARRFGAVTAFGRVADPFADKVLVCGAMVMLLEFPAARELMAPWFVVVILSREFLVTTIRGLAESQGHAFPAERLGKYKMVAQCVLVSGLMSLVAGTRVFESVTVASLWLTLVLTITSAVQYVYRARGILFAA